MELQRHLYATYTHTPPLVVGVLYVFSMRLPLWLRVVYFIRFVTHSSACRWSLRDPVPCLVPGVAIYFVRALSSIC